jgi:hypothetical protein
MSKKDMTMDERIAKAILLLKGVIKLLRGEK